MSDNSDPKTPGTVEIPDIIGYQVVRHLPPPALQPGTLATYEVAGNGLFYHAARPELEARIWIADAPVRGLPPLSPFAHLKLPKVPSALLEAMLAYARSEVDAAGEPLEVLFHLLHEAQDVQDAQEGRDVHEPGDLSALGGRVSVQAPSSASVPNEHCQELVVPGWKIFLPAQRQTRFSVEPLEVGPTSTYERAIIEVHSHHDMAAFYSSIDRDDDRWLRYNVVLGRINAGAPEILVHVGADGYHMTIPARTIFELPHPLDVRDVYDANARDPRGSHASCDTHDKQVRGVGKPVMGSGYDGYGGGCGTHRRTDAGWEVNR